MAFYLSMDGVDDTIQVPSVTIDTVILDFSVTRTTSKNQFYFDVRSGFPWGYIQLKPDGNSEVLSDSAMTVYINDSTEDVMNNTAFVPLGERMTMKTVFSSVFTDNVTVFNHSGGNFAPMVGYLYDIKLYNGDTLVAHYDMTTQTVDDQSGNGNHATLTGGTWVDDGTGGDPGTDVSFTFPMTQAFYADRQAGAPMKQSIYADREASVPLAQSIYADRSWTAPTDQLIYFDREYTYPMEQQLYADYVAFSASFPLHQAIYADRSFSFETEQNLYDDRQYSFPMSITMHDGTEVVGRISLSGNRVLRVTLSGDRVLRVSLQGDRELRIALRGDVMTTEKVNFEMMAGDTKFLDVTATDNSSIFDITGCTIRWALMRKKHSSEQLISKETGDGVQITDAAVGLFTINLDPADTEGLVGRYYHEAELVDVLGNKSTIFTGHATML